LLGYGFSLTDHLSGIAGALAALEGIEHRERTGEGLSVDLSQYELGLGLMGPAFIDYFANGTNPEPVGNRHPYGGAAPHGIYPCRGEDRWVAIAVTSDEEWRAVAGLVGGDLAADTRFESLSGRLAHEDALDGAIAAWTVNRDSSEVADLLQTNGIAAGPVQNAEDLSRDPALVARDFFGTANAAAWGEYGLDRFPALFNGERPPTYEGVHAVGEDTFDVATGIVGLDDEAVAELAASGALS
jgi:crotonobetainyl-CoA:carnitine CoA-transferase CaiB-like acyl-CoA transferase